MAHFRHWATSPPRPLTSRWLPNELQMSSNDLMKKKRLSGKMPLVSLFPSPLTGPGSSTHPSFPQVLSLPVCHWGTVNTHVKKTLLNICFWFFVWIRFFFRFVVFGWVKVLYFESGLKSRIKTIAPSTYWCPAQNLFAATASTIRARRGHRTCRWPRVTEGVLPAGLHAVWTWFKSKHCNCCICWRRRYFVFLQTRTNSFTCI